MHNCYSYQSLKVSRRSFSRFSYDEHSNFSLGGEVTWRDLVTWPWATWVWNFHSIFEKDLQIGVPKNGNMLTGYKIWGRPSPLRNTADIIVSTLFTLHTPNHLVEVAIGRILRRKGLMMFMKWTDEATQKIKPLANRHYGFWDALSPKTVTTVDRPAAHNHNSPVSWRVNGHRRAYS